MRLYHPLFHASTTEGLLDLLCNLVIISVKEENDVHDLWMGRGCPTAK